jgi:hypothetical protein
MTERAALQSRIAFPLIPKSLAASISAISVFREHPKVLRRNPSYIIP